MRWDWRVVSIVTLAPLAFLVVAPLLDSAAGIATGTAMVVTLATEATIALRTRSVSVRRSERLLSAAPGVAFIAGFAHATTGWPGVVPAPTPLVVTLAVLSIAGAALRVAAFMALGRWFVASVAIVEGQELVRRGPYAVTRHPGYVGYWLYSVCLVGLTGSLPALALSVACATTWIALRVRDEEAALTLAFGKEWHEYAATTRRYIGVRPWSRLWARQARSR